jgi:AcrR family transcriptional regulator
MPETKPTKQRILEAAAELFSREGFSAVSIRDITRAVGIKESSLYNHFSSKDQILEQILTDFQSEYRKILPPVAMLDQLLARTTPADFLMRGFLNLIKRLSDPAIQQMWRVLHMEQYRHPKARAIMLNDLIGQTLTFLEEVFTRLIAMGKLKPLDPKALAASYQYPVFAMATEWSLLTFAGEDASPIERRMTEHIELFLKLTQPD